MPTLRELRKSKNWRQADVAAALGVKKAAYCLWESGKRGVSLANALALARLYGLRVEDISFPALEVHKTKTA